MHYFMYLHHKKFRWCMYVNDTVSSTTILQNALLYVLAPSEVPMVHVCKWLFYDLPRKIKIAAIYFRKWLQTSLRLSSSIWAEAFADPAPVTSAPLFATEIRYWAEGNKTDKRVSGASTAARTWQQTTQPVAQHPEIASRGGSSSTWWNIINKKKDENVLEKPFSSRFSPLQWR